MRVAVLQFVGIALLIVGVWLLSVGAWEATGIVFALGVALLILAATAGVLAWMAWRRVE
jgi:hypothetical protein